MLAELFAYNQNVTVNIFRHFSRGLPWCSANIRQFPSVFCHPSLHQQLPSRLSICDLLALWSFLPNQTVSWTDSLFLS
jgi:hypothetical protein